ncbi:MAG: hypothetical protein AAF467_22350 [Actinomycetota bacterium]
MTKPPQVGDRTPDVPPELAPALSESAATTRQRHGWRREYSALGALHKWKQTIDEIGQFRAYGSDDYQHLLSYRVALQEILVTLLDLGHLQALRWLQKEVDQLDQDFLARSRVDEHGLILRSDKDNPAYWFLRRLPKDDNVVEHLRMIQPKEDHGQQPPT